MPGEVRTGGRKKFVSGEGPELDDELANKIDKGYRKAAERKRRERRNRLIKIGIGTGIAILVLIFILIYYIL